MVQVYAGNKYKKLSENAANGVLLHFGINFQEIDVEIGFLSEHNMQILNKRSRGKDSVTDVLSFPALDLKFPYNLTKVDDVDKDPETGNVILGEIYICEERAKEQAKQYNHSLAREIAFLVTHGMLHLLGFNHENEEQRKEMEDLQDKILVDSGLTRDILDNDYIDFDAKEDDDIFEFDEEELDEQSPVPVDFKCGKIAVLGRPNAGKSTIINHVVGEKVAIVSWKPQTTRNKILGIANIEDKAQILFVDTPGLHEPKNALGKYMMRTVTAALNEVDAVLYVVNAEKEFNFYDKENVQRYIDAGKNVIVAVNKIDRIAPTKIGEMLTEINKIKDVFAVVPISAMRGTNMKDLVDEIMKLLPYGEPLYPKDMYTDEPMTFVVAETVREKALKLLDEEIPYGIAVAVNKYDEREDGIIDIDASVIIQKDSHKGILLGKGGSMIKKISTYAREDLEKITGQKIFLTLWVRVEKDWRLDENAIKKFGYDKKDLKD